MKDGKDGLVVSPRSSHAERENPIKRGRISTVSGKRVDGHGREVIRLDDKQSGIAEYNCKSQSSSLVEAEAVLFCPNSAP